MTSKTIIPKSRFCPSPTGNIHIGNVRTALFSALFAKSIKGTFLLRIEDTDRERSDEKYTQALMRDLQWLGLHWDEGPQVGGQLGPYYQSQRLAIYNDYYQQLEHSDLAYPCFCSEEQLALMRKIQRSMSKPPRYAGTCRTLTQAQIQEKLAQGIKPTLRFKVPEGEFVEFEDMVHGLQRFNTSDIGDFIIRRTDGTPPFLFCNAIDDATMQVTHVVRGEDHLTNTPRQIMILRALNLSVPQYGHISMILGNDGTPLAKRHGSRSIQELRHEGYLASAIINYLARLGHYYGHDDFLSLEELAAQFKKESLSKSPAKFDFELLNHWQKHAVMRLNKEEILKWLGPEIVQKIPESGRDIFIDLIKPNILFPHEALRWIQIIFEGDLSIGETETNILKQVGSDYFRVAISGLEQHGPDLAAITAHIKSVLGIKGVMLYQPIRIALTGQTHGPELTKILQLMGPEKIRRRLELAL